MFLADVNDNAYILVPLCLSCTVIMCTHNIYSQSANPGDG